MIPYNTFELIMLGVVAVAFGLGYWRGHVAGHHAGFAHGLLTALDPDSNFEVIRQKSDEVDDDE